MFILSPGFPRHPRRLAVPHARAWGVLLLGWAGCTTKPAPTASCSPVPTDPAAECAEAGCSPQYTTAQTMDLPACSDHDDVVIASMAGFCAFEPTGTCTVVCDCTGQPLELDADGDGEASPELGGTDCDDTDPALYSGDRDGDGYSTCDGDCDDTDPSLHPADPDGDGYSSCDGDCAPAIPWLFPVDTDADGQPDRCGALDVGAGLHHTCALDPAGQAVCWGDNTHGQLDAPTTAFERLAVGGNHSCGHRASGRVECWGSNDLGQSQSGGDAEYVSVDAGQTHTCGLSSTGTIRCWGDSSYGQSSVPPGTFTALATGYFHSCGLDEDGAGHCWGFDDDGRNVPPDGEFSMLAAGDRHTCGIDPLEMVVCWGDDTHGQLTPPIDPGTVDHISAGARHTCILTEGTAICWGDDSAGQSTPPDTAFVTISAGAAHTCGVEATGAVTCWGSNDSGQQQLP